MTLPPNTGLVLGAGGLAGHAYHAGVLSALQDELGWDARTATTIVGSSAGSLTGAALRLGASPVDLAAVLCETLPSSEGQALFDALGPRDVELPPFAPRDLLRPWNLPSLRLLRRMALRPWTIRWAAATVTLLPAGKVDLLALVEGLDALAPTWPDGLWICAARRDDGRRRVFGREGGPTARLGEAVAASCAIPGYFAPVEIGGVQYFDGGVHSPTSADLLRTEALDLAVVVSPMSSHGPDRSVMALMRRSAHRRLAREVATLRRVGTDVVTFEPTPAVRAAMGPNPMDEERVPSIVEAARDEVFDRLRRTDLGARFTCAPTPAITDRVA